MIEVLMWIVIIYFMISGIIANAMLYFVLKEDWDKLYDNSTKD